MGEKSLGRPFLYLTKDLSVAWLCWVGTGFDGAQLLQGGCSPLLTSSCSDRNCSSIFPSSVAPLSGTGHGCRDHLFKSLTTLVQIPLLPPVICGTLGKFLGEKALVSSLLLPKRAVQSNECINTWPVLATMLGTGYNW